MMQGYAKGQRIGASAALIGAPMTLLNIALFIAVGDGDMGLIFHPARALVLSPEKIWMFRLGMLADTFGYYLPMLAIGGYLWSRLREKGGAAVDMAVLFLGVYVTLGVAGTSMQIAGLPALAGAHASPDVMVRVSSETAWLTLVNATERGLWWMEGPTLAFWGIVTGAAMRAQGMKFGRLLMLTAALYGVDFVLAFVGMAEVSEYVEIFMLILLALWLLLMGIDLTQKKTA